MVISFEAPPEEALGNLRAGFSRMKIGESESFAREWRLLSNEIDVARGIPLYRLDKLGDWPPSFVGWNYLILNEGMPFAFADLERSSEGQRPLILQRLVRGPSLRGYVTALLVAKKISKDPVVSYQLRMLEIFDLNFRMLWLCGKDDKFVLIRPVFLGRRFRRVVDMKGLRRNMRQLRRLLSTIHDEPKARVLEP